MAKAETKSEEAREGTPIIIKKYANRRLYNTESSAYVTLDHLAELVKQGRDFVVKDAKSGEDITRSVLAQIIFEQESKGQTLLPVPFLRQLISFYDNQLQSIVPGYLQSAMGAFTKNQETLRKTFESSLQPGQALSMFDELARQNMALFERSMQMFSPFGKSGSETETAPPESASRQEGKIDALERQLSEIQKQLDELREK